MASRLRHFPPILLPHVCPPEWYQSIHFSDCSVSIPELFDNYEIRWILLYQAIFRVIWMWLELSSQVSNDSRVCNSKSVISLEALLGTIKLHPFCSFIFNWLDCYLFISTKSVAWEVPLSSASLFNKWQQVYCSFPRTCCKVHSEMVVLGIPFSRTQPWNWDVSSLGDNLAFSMVWCCKEGYTPVNSINLRSILQNYEELLCTVPH